MSISLIKTTNQTIKVVTLTILIKLFFPGFVMKNLQAKQKMTAFFLPVIKNQKKRELDKNEILWRFQQQLPTKIWMNKLGTAITTNSNYRSDLPQDNNSVVQKNNSNKTNSLATSIELSIEEKIVNTFIQRIHNPIPLHIELKNKASSIGKGRIITVISSFPISQQKCQDLAIAIRENIASKAIIEFKTKDDPIRKIELCDRGYKISGNLNNYIIEVVRKVKMPVNH